MYPRYLPKVQIIALLLIGVLLLFLPLPYSVIAPGPTTNLLNGPIAVAPSLLPAAGTHGESSTKTSGALLSLTVFVTTPDAPLTATDLAAAWMRGDEMVLPKEILYPHHEKSSQAGAQSKAEMDSSSKSAIAAVSGFLHRDIPTSDVTVKLRDTGGPSAGLAFALALVAKIDRPQLFAKHTIAATGTINSDGAVGAIGGIDQKLIGAHRSKAEAVFIPADNCVDITRTPRDLLVIPVSSLSQAVAILGAYSRTRIQSLPHC